MLREHGKTICITTYGDSFKYDIEPALNRAKQMFGKIDLFVCAAHGNGLKEIRTLGNVVEIDKVFVADKSMHDESNEEFAKKVVKTINDVVKK